MSARTIKLLIFLLCFLLMGIRLLYIPATERDHVYGDGYSDINTLSAARFFHDSGFVKTAFLPVHGYPQSHPTKVYTHYPALPDILAGCTATVLNTGDERALRLFPFLLSIFFFFLIYRVLNSLTGDFRSAFIGASMLVLSNYFIAWGDNLHQHLYAELVKWMFIGLLFQYQEAQRKSRSAFLGLLVLMVLAVNISFELPVYLGVATAGFALIYQRSLFTRETLGLFAALLFGFALHILQNVLYLDSFRLAIEDMKNALVFRTTGADDVGYIPEKPFSVAQNAWQIPIDWFNRMERYYPLPGWFLLATLFWSLPVIRKQSPRLFQICIALFVASAAWGVVMPQHAYVHLFTNKHFGLWVGLMMAISLPVYFQVVKQHFQEKKTALMALHIGLIGYAAVMCITQQLIGLWWKHGCIYVLGLN